MIGTQLGSFEIVAKLGQGGMGEVYRARDARLGRDVAIKVLPATLTTDRTARERLRREAVAAAGLDHPFICKIFEIGEADGQLFVVMEFVEGETLHKSLTRGPLSSGTLVPVALELAQALEAAHGRHVVHRDLKPSNIMLTLQGHTKVMDFGLAKVVDAPDSETRLDAHGPLTDPGARVGTPAYMSPEQIAGGSVDHRSDIFALGVVLAEALTGRHPFERPTTAGTVTAVLNDPPLLQPPDELGAIHPALRAILLRMLAKSPDERYDSVSHVHTDLRSLESSRADTAALLSPVPGAELQQRRRWPMVGRDAERAELMAALERTMNGQGGVVLIGGEPGIGKTRLTEEVLLEARRRGASPVIGHCYEMQGAPPYVPFVEITEHTARIVPREALRRLMGDAAPEVAKLMPELRQMFPDIPPAVDLPAEQQRWYFFNAYKGFVERACRLAPIVAVFEDLHWADEPTLQLLLHLAKPAQSMGLLIVGTYRDVELDVSRPFAATLESLLRQRLATRIPVRRLPASGVDALLTAMSGKPAPASFSRVVFRETEGNPFFVEEVFQHLAEEGHLFDPAGEWRTDLKLESLSVPEGVRLVIGRRLERVSEPARRILTTAAVIGRSFSLALLDAVEGSAGPDAALDAIEEAERAHLVTPNTVGRDPQYMFAHELIRQTLADALSLPRRQRLHIRIAAAMETLYRATPEKHATAMAHHFYQAGTSADPVKTTDYLVMAARQASAASGHEDALTLLDNALSLWEGERVERVADLQLLRSTVLQSLARRTEAIAAAALAAAIYRERRNFKAYANAMGDSANQRAWMMDIDGAVQDTVDALAVLREAPPELSVSLLYSRANMVAVKGEAREAARVLADAEALRSSLDDHVLDAWAVGIRAKTAYHIGRVRLAVDSAKEAMARMRALGRPWDAVDCGWPAVSCLALGLGRGAVDEARRELEDADGLGHHGVAWVSRQVGLIRDLMALDMSAVAGTHADVLSYGETHGVPWAYQTRMVQALFMFLRGDHDDAIHLLETVAASEPPTSWAQVSRSMLFCLLAHTSPDRARRVRTTLPAQLPAADAPSAIGSWANLAWTVLGLDALDDHEGIASLDPLAAAAEVQTDVKIAGFVPLPLICAMTAGGVRDWSRAERHFVEARDLTEQAEIRLFSARVLEAHADMLVRRASADDREHAMGLYDQAAADYARNGLEPFARRLSRKRGGV